MSLQGYYDAYPELAASELLYILSPPSFNGVPSGPVLNPLSGTPYASTLGPKARAAEKLGTVRNLLRAMPTTARFAYGPALGEVEAWFGELLARVPEENYRPEQLRDVLVELIGPRVLESAFVRENVAYVERVFGVGVPMTTVALPAALTLADVARARDRACAAAANPAGCGAEFQRIAFAAGVPCNGDPLCQTDVLNRTSALYERGRTVGILDSILSGASTAAGAVVSNLPAILQTLAQAGVIRGSVGQALAPQMNPAGTTFSQAQMDFTGLGLLPQVGSVAGRVLTNPTVQGAAGAVLGGLGLDALESLFSSGATCGVSRPAVQAPTLFKMNACGKMSINARTQVIGPDGAIYVVASLGRATRGSREASVARRLARDNGFTLGRRGGAGRRARRRPR